MTGAWPSECWALEQSATALSRARGGGPAGGFPATPSFSGPSLASPPWARMHLCPQIMNLAPILFFLNYFHSFCACSQERDAPLPADCARPHCARLRDVCAPIRGHAVSPLSFGRACVVCVLLSPGLECVCVRVRFLSLPPPPPPSKLSPKIFCGWVNGSRSEALCPAVCAPRSSPPTPACPLALCALGVCRPWRCAHVCNAFVRSPFSK